MDQNNQNIVQMEEKLDEMDGQTIVFNIITKVEKELNGLEIGFYGKITRIGWDGVKFGNLK
jgi:hypothetical protein